MNDAVVIIWIFLLVVLLLSAGLAFMSVIIVDQGSRYTIEYFGKYTRTLEPGINFIIPFFEYIAHKVNMKEQVMDVPSQEVITRDNAMIRVDGVVFHQVINAAEAMYQVDNLTDAILNLTMTNIRTVMGSMELDELLSKRDEINHRLLTVVDEATTPWGVKILRIEIKDIAPPKDLVDSMARQLKAERDKRAAVLEAQGKKEADVLVAEGKKQSAILEAEGRKEAAFRDAEAREREAEAEAKSTMMLSQAITRGNVNAINYFIALKYVEALKEIGSAENQKIIMMPLEASSVIGSIAGIGELAKEAFNSKNASSVEPKPPATPKATE